jgi:hypothetical protein
MPWRGWKDILFRVKDELAKEDGPGGHDVGDKISKAAKARQERLRTRPTASPVRTVWVRLEPANAGSERLR